MGLDKVRFVDLATATGAGACLTFIEGGRHLPFDIRRVYYLYDIEPGVQRGGHAHKQHEELIIAAAGSFDIILDDGYRTQRFPLDRPNRGIFFPTMVWHELENFAPGSVCLVLASLYYDQEDYFRDYDEFVAAVRGSG